MFRDLKPYPECAHTAAGLRPPHWTARSMGSLLRQKSERNRPDLPLLSVARERGVFVRSAGDDNHNVVPDDLTNYKVARKGDLVVNKMKAWQGSMGVAPTDGVVSPAYYVYDLALENAGYAHLLLRSKPYVAHYVAASDGVRIGQWDLSDARFRRIPLSIPPVDEQEAIVTYLAHAHQRINQAIATKRRLIALLEEQKQALTRQAVTAGLGAGTLRDSGFAHIGLIPAHWRVLRAKHLFREFDLRSGTGQETLLSLRQAAGLVHHHEVSPIAIQPEALMNYKVVMPGAVVMNRMRAASGVFAVAREIGLVSPDYSTMSVGEHVVADYYLYLFKTPELMAEFRRRSSGLGTGESGFMRLQYEAFGRIPLPVPPAAEQQAIANLVEERRAIVDAQIDLARREIGALQEFSTCLTAEVVTGQLDVRGVAAALPRIDPAAVFASASVDACEDDGEALEGDALEEA